MFNFVMTKLHLTLSLGLTIALSFSAPLSAEADEVKTKSTHQPYALIKIDPLTEIRQPLVEKLCQIIIQSIAPQSIAPQSIAPQSIAPQSIAPQSIAPQSIPSQSILQQSLAPQMLSNQVHCYSGIKYSDQEFDKDVQELSPRFVIKANLLPNGKIKYQITDRLQNDPDLVQSLFTFSSDLPSSLEEARLSLMRAQKFFDHIQQIKALALEMNLQINNQLGSISNQQSTTFNQQSSSANQQGVAPHNLDKFEKKEIPKNDLSEKRNYLLASSFLLGVLAIGKSWYDKHQELNSVDWDFASFKEGVLAKFRLQDNAVAYDNNGWNINRDHIYAGFTYYLACRSSNFTATESFICAMAASTLWEVAIEAREVLAINDQINTIFGGSILAEAFQQMGCFISKRGNSFFRSTIGLPWKAQNAINTGTGQLIFQSKESSFTSRLCQDNPSGRFEIEIGAIRTTNSNQSDSSNQGARVRIYNVTQNKSLTNEEQFRGWISNLIQSELDMTFDKNGKEWTQSISADLFLAGYAFILNEVQNQRSGTFVIGPSTGLTISDNPNPQDFYAIVHLLGGTAQMTLVQGTRKFISQFSLYGDSMMMHSFAVKKFIETNPDKEVLANIKDNSMYNGFGFTQKGQVEIKDGKLKLNIVSINSHARSTFWRPRANPANGPAVNYDLVLKDRVRATTLTVQYELFKNFNLGALSSWQKHTSTSEAGTFSEKIKKVGLTVSYHF